MLSVKALQSHITALYRLSFTVSMATRALETYARGRGGSAVTESFSITSSLTLLIPHSLLSSWLTVLMRRERVVVKCLSMSSHPSPSTAPRCSSHSSNRFIFEMMMTSLWRLFWFEVSSLLYWTSCNFLKALFSFWQPCTKCWRQQSISIISDIFAV